MKHKQNYADKLKSFLMVNSDATMNLKANQIVLKRQFIRLLCSYHQSEISDNRYYIQKCNSHTTTVLLKVFTSHSSTGKCVR